MTKPGIHYVVFTNDGTLEKLNSIDTFLRQDVKLIIQRTFIKSSGGQGLYQYHKNEVINRNLKVIKNNSFKWNNLQCKLDEYEYWGKYILGSDLTTICLDIEVKDHLKKVNKMCFRVDRDDSFENIQKDLQLLDKVGSYQAFIEIRNLERKLGELKVKLEKEKAKTKFLQSIKK